MFACLLYCLCFYARADRHGARWNSHVHRPSGPGTGGGGSRKSCGSPGVRLTSTGQHGSVGFSSQCCRQRQHVMSTQFIHTPAADPELDYCEKSSSDHFRRARALRISDHPLFLILFATLSTAPNTTIFPSVIPTIHLRECSRCSVGPVAALRALPPS